MRLRRWGGLAAVRSVAIAIEVQVAVVIEGQAGRVRATAATRRADRGRDVQRLTQCPAATAVEDTEGYLAAVGSRHVAIEVPGAAALLHADALAVARRDLRVGRRAGCPHVLGHARAGARAHLARRTRVRAAADSVHAVVARARVARRADLAQRGAARAVSVAWRNGVRLAPFRIVGAVEPRIHRGVGVAFGIAARAAVLDLRRQTRVVRESWTAQHRARAQPNAIERNAAKPWCHGFLPANPSPPGE